LVTGVQTCALPISLHLRIGSTLSPSYDCTGVSHSFSGRSGSSCNIRRNRLRIMSLGDVISRILFRRPSNLANQDDSVGRLVVPEHLEDVDEVQTSNGVSSDPKTCGLSDTRVSQIRRNFIRQRPAS